MPRRARRDADADGDREALRAARRAAPALARTGPPRTVGGAQRHPVAGDVRAQLLEVRQRLVHVLPREEDGEFLAAVAERDAAAADPGEARGDELQHLVADVVTVGVVEFLEVVDVDHRHRVAPPGRLQPLVERAPSRQAGELVAERHAVRIAQHRDDEQRRGRGDERGEGERRADQCARRARTRRSPTRGRSRPACAGSTRRCTPPRGSPRSRRARAAGSASPAATGGLRAGGRASPPRPCGPIRRSTPPARTPRRAPGRGLRRGRSLRRAPPARRARRDPRARARTRRRRPRARRASPGRARSTSGRRSGARRDQRCGEDDAAAVERDREERGRTERDPRPERLQPVERSRDRRRALRERERAGEQRHRQRRREQQSEDRHGAPTAGTA